MKFPSGKMSSPIFTSIFITALFLLLFISSISYNQMRSTNESGKMVTHTYQVQLMLEQLFSMLKDAESGQRGYIITHDSTFLKQYLILNETISPVLSEIDRMTKDNKEQHAALDYLKVLIKRRMELLQSAITISDRKLTVTRDILTSDAMKSQLIIGKNVMDLIRKHINKMTATEMELLEAREKKHQNEIAVNPVMLFMLAFFSLIVFTGSFYKINKDEKELKELNRKIMMRNKELEQQLLTEFTESFAAYKTGDEFFNSLTKDISAKTKMDYVFVGELVKLPDGENVIKTFSLTAFGRLHENIQYPLPDGPCEQIITGTDFTYPKKVRETFPKNNTVSEFNVEGYIGYPLYDSHANAIGLIAVMHEKEITEVSYIESLLRIAAKRAELELERIRNNRLLETKNMELERQNAELASFNHVASHDLQEPLRKIQTFISRIFDNELETISDTGKDYFMRIQKSANRMQMLIDDLLTFSRTNKADQVFETVDLNILLENAKQELAPTIEEKQATIRSNHLPTLEVIPFQFYQLLINLIGNSLKYSKPDVKPVIQITVEIIDRKLLHDIRANPQKSYYKISFIDNGVGFEQKYADNIFVLFQRLHGRSEYSGTGIGLAICKKIVENHQGFITAEGRPGIGASFHIFLPV